MCNGSSFERSKLNLLSHHQLVKTHSFLYPSLGKKVTFTISQRENVNRKKLQSFWWNVKNYIFGTVMTNPIRNF